MKYLFLTLALLLGSSSFAVSHAQCQGRAYNRLYQCLRTEDKADFAQLCNQFSADMQQIRQNIEAKRSEITAAKQSGQYQHIKQMGREINKMERSFGERRKAFHLEAAQRFKANNPACFNVQPRNSLCVSVGM